jgi:hypothetical protein
MSQAEQNQPISDRELLQALFRQAVDGANTLRAEHNLPKVTFGFGSLRPGLLAAMRKVGLSGDGFEAAFLELDGEFFDVILQAKTGAPPLPGATISRELQSRKCFNCVPGDLLHKLFQCVYPFAHYETMTWTSDNDEQMAFRSVEANVPLMAGTYKVLVRAMNDVLQTQLAADKFLADQGTSFTI